MSPGSGLMALATLDTMVEKVATNCLLRFSRVGKPLFYEEPRGHGLEGHL